MYYVGVGTGFSKYSRRAPVIHGIMKYLKSRNQRNEGNQDFKRLAEELLADIETTRAIAWAGSIAGYPPGRHIYGDTALLVTQGPRLIDPVPGDIPVIQSLLDQVLGAEEPQSIFWAWTAIGLRAVIASQHQPGPMLCISGPVRSGKSLLAKIVQTVLGGRAANPHAAWSNGMQWNDDLTGSELLLLDDCEASTDHRSRRNLAANFKEAIYSNEVQIRKRHTSSMALRPVWRVMMCCNDNPDSLQIIPPIDEDLSDKIILLRALGYTPPIDTSSTEGRSQLWQLILDELPAFVHYLRNYQIPEAIRASRSGVIAYRDCELESAVSSLSQERVMEDMLVTMIEAGDLIKQGEQSTTLTASDLQNRMMALGSPVYSQARALFGHWSAACGVYLGRISRSRPSLVREGTVVRGIQRWIISRPQ